MCCFLLFLFSEFINNIFPNFSKLSDDRRISRETDGYNENCLGVRFALCIIKALRLARIEHCSGTSTVVTPFLPSVNNIFSFTKISCPLTVDIMSVDMKGALPEQLGQC